jgi:4-amino-4-deoxy-L-arabinose transferase-like glycosyltransferase
VNPILAGINTLLAFLLLDRLYGRSTARWALLLLAASPWHVFMAMNFMTHTASFTFALIAANAAVLATKARAVFWAILSGLAVGGAVLVRPLEGFTLGCVLALALLAGQTSARRKLALLVAYGAGGALLGIPHLYYNQHLTGNPLKFPIMAYFDKYYGPDSNALGFGPNRGVGWAIDPNPGHSVFDALVNANLNAFSMNIELFGWGAGSLVLAALFLFAGRLRRLDWWMLTVCAAIFTAHFFYYFSGGPDFGARYWYLMLIPCVVFTIGGIRLLKAHLERDFPGSGPRLTTVVIALCAMSLINYFPWRAIDKYHHYQQMRPDVLTLARQRNFGRALVLVQGDRHPDYASAATYNPLDLTADAPIYAWDRSPEVRRQVLQAYPDRPVWILEGPTRTGGGFRVKAGPLAAGELLKSEPAPAGAR